MRLSLPLVAGLCLFVSACGGSSAAQGTSTTQSRAVAYATCMRSHGVSKWPDPNSNGVFDKAKLGLQQLGVSSSQLQTAASSCQHLLPNGGRGPDAAQEQHVRALGLEFASCVRAHGVPSFPDPDSTGRIPDPASVGVDQGSPKFRAANTACGKYRPPYMPSNAEYNAYLRSQGG